MQDLTFTPAEFVAVINQTLEFAYPSVVIEGELSNFKISKNRWVYFDLKDEEASVRFFGTIYMLPGPLEDGLKVRVFGTPRLHPKFGFSVNFQTVQPLGEGSLKKAADLLYKKLDKEGLFAIERKRTLPPVPQSIGLIGASGSAGATDFIKILNDRWGGVDVFFSDVYVQGDQAPIQLSAAISHFNQLSIVPDVLVITRGGGSADDLAAFNDERVVRAVASSRIPTLVAIGHEIDVSLAELAADQRASTPSNAAQVLVPDKKHELDNLKRYLSEFKQQISIIFENENINLQNQRETLSSYVKNIFAIESESLKAIKKIIESISPNAAMRRGYAIIRKENIIVKSINNVLKNDVLNVSFADGKINAKVVEVFRNDKAS